MHIPGQEQAGRNIVKWAERDEWVPRRAEVFAHHLLVATENGLSQDELADLLGTNFIGLFAFILEDFLSSRFEDDQNIIDSYFARHGWRETVPAKRYFEALRDSTASLYEVVALDPGRTITLRDLILDDEPIVVEQTSDSSSVAPWDCIAARVAVLHKRLIFTGGTLYFTRGAANEVQRQFDEMADAVKADILKAMEKEMRGTDADLDDYDFTVRDTLLAQHNVAAIFTQVWLADVLEGLLDPPSEIHNTDGEACMFCDTFFPVKASTEEIAEVLDGLDILSRDPPDEFGWAWLAPPSPSGASSRGGGIGIDCRNTLNQTVLGTLRLTAEELVLYTNSAERADKGQALLATHLGERVGPPSTSQRTPQQARDEESEALLTESALPDVPEEVRQAMQAHMDDHYRRALDEPVPALDGKTPRQAAGTEEGRAQVINWLRLLENLEYRHSMDTDSRPYDARWIWEELGIKHPGS